MSLNRATFCLLSRNLQVLAQQPCAMYGSGSNPDGGAGAVRDAGGAFAKREAAQEDQYFRKLQTEQLKNLKNHVEEEIKHHQEEIQRHHDAVKRLKEKSSELEK